ncbi:MAG TPA: ATP-dependent DNA ligase [Actinomycetota bacterium]|nr:ATP-dependent DNA ligase [Actinomycetota bacterium]
MEQWPVPPLLARLTRRLPEGDFLYEPKWDGLRCLARRADTEVDMRSRNLRPLARYFPELTEAFAALPARRYVLDGEIVAFSGDRFDFAALLARLHPAASRVERLRRETPAAFVAFDLLEVEDEDLTRTAASERRRRLEEVLQGARPPLFLTPVTEDAATARDWLVRFSGNGIDGVIAKPPTSTYEPGKRVLVKVKRERTLDAVVGGMRLVAGEPLVASLLLGLFDDHGILRHVGVASAFSDQRRRELYDELAPAAVAFTGHPWEHGFNLGKSPLGRLGGAAARWTSADRADWTPLRPELVCEVAYDQWEGDRFRHPARFKHWRPDRDPQSCTFDQLQIDEAASSREMLVAP